jgi:hypothetical protein
MPGRDGTGPLSEGPLTGRGLGPCGGRRRRRGGLADDDFGAGMRRRRRRRAGFGMGGAVGDPSDLRGELAALHQRLERIERQLSRRDPDPAD